MLRIIDGGLPALPAIRCSVREERRPYHSNEHLLDAMREHVERLRLIQSVVTLSVMALRRQDAERDEDIASVLDHHAAASLTDQVCELGELLERIEQSPAADAAGRREAS